MVASATANGDVCRIPVKATVELAVTHESDVGVSSPEQLRALGGIGPGLGAKWRKYRPLQKGSDYGLSQRYFIGESSPITVFTNKLRGEFWGRASVPAVGASVFSNLY